MSDENWIAKTITPNSNQLNADDLIAGPIVVTVTDVRQGESDQPVVLVIDGDRQPYKPCKTMRRLLVSLWGERASDWIGQRLELYADPDVKWGGVAVGGIRISAVSGIDQPHTVMLTVTRGKRQAVTIKPLQTVKQPKAIETQPTDWKALFVQHNVIQQAQLLRDAPTAEDRESILSAASSQMADGTITLQAYDVLSKYAATKN